MTPEAVKRIPARIDIPALLAKARERLYQDPNVIGVGVGLRRRAGQLVNEPTLIVYVKSKLKRDDVPTEYLVPAQFGGLETDVVAPFAGAPKEALEFATVEHRQASLDMMFVDRARIHEQAVATKKEA